jgi:hypothetical protein
VQSEQVKVYCGPQTQGMHHISFYLTLFTTAKEKGKHITFGDIALAFMKKDLAFLGRDV